MKLENDNRCSPALIEQVESLNQEVKSLAINLAIYLAKTKTDSDFISQMEPDFIKLVNGTVKVVQELAVIINAARNMETMVYEVPSGMVSKDIIETKLNSIVEQCHKIILDLTTNTDMKIDL